MLGSNDVSYDAKSNSHANVTNLTLDKAHGCRYTEPDTCMASKRPKTKFDEIFTEPKF